jgi:hypothetical protein
MKPILHICFTVFVCFSMSGMAIGQDSYSGYYPYQGQNSGGYGYSSSGYDQSYPALGPGSSYGYGSPYGYSEQSAPQGNQGQYGYDQYPGMPGYGRYDNAPVGSGSYGFPSGYPQTQSNDPTLRSRLAQPRNRSGSPDVRESTRIVTPSRRGATAGATQPVAVRSDPDENGPLYGREIYWDGRESDRQESSAVPTGSRPSQTVNTRVPAAVADNAERQIRPFSNLNQEQKSKRTRSNVVRQQNKASLASPPPPPPSDLKWGKEDSSSSEQQSLQPKSSFKWGMQGKPAMIGAEPGRSESSQGSTQLSQQNTQSSGAGEGKKFQWGKVQ